MHTVVLKREKPPARHPRINGARLSAASHQDPHTDPLALQIQQTVFSHGLSAVSSPSANASSSPRGVLQQPEKTGNDSTTERGQRVEGPARPQGMHRAQSTGKRGCLSPEERNTSSITYLGLEIQVLSYFTLSPFLRGHRHTEQLPVRTVPASGVLWPGSGSPK